MEEVIIRKFGPSDREAVRTIAWETAFLGEPADRFFSGKDILADFLTGYFTDYEPQSCFVAAKAHEVVGYLIGSTDERAVEKTFLVRILPGLFLKFIFSRGLFKTKNLQFIAHILVSAVKGEFKCSDLGHSYPATMHINIKVGFRGQGIGERLIAAFCEYLKRSGIPGFHLATMSERAGEFFVKQELIPLRQYRRSYFRYLLRKDMAVYIYGKKL